MDDRNAQHVHAAAGLLAAAARPGPATVPIHDLACVCTEVARLRIAAGRDSDQPGTAADRLSAAAAAARLRDPGAATVGVAPEDLEEAVGEYFRLARGPGPLARLAARLRRSR